jgi:signal transduction histidine kinase
MELDYLRQVLDAMPAGVLIADNTAHFLVCNATAQALVGADLTGSLVPRTQEEAELGPSISTIWRLDGSPIERPELPLERALFQGETTHNLQLLLERPADGKRIPIIANAAPLRDASNAIIGAVVIFQDITAINEMEQQREDFLATVSHDLKNPLTSILGTSQMLVRRARNLDDLESQRFIDALSVIIQAGQRMATQIDEIMDVTRHQIGQNVELVRTPTDLVALLSRLVDEYQRTTDQHTIRLVTTVDKLIALVDAERMQRSIANLLGNAVKYSPHGGVIEATLVAFKEGKDEFVAISIVDHGIGIPATDVPSVFDRFYRASNVPGDITGTGLGLASVKQVAEQHGGTVELASTLESGTTVTVRLPLLRPPSAGS